MKFISVTRAWRRYSRSAPTGAGGSAAATASGAAGGSGAAGDGGGAVGGDCGGPSAAGAAGAGCDSARDSSARCARQYRRPRMSKHVRQTTTSHPACSHVRPSPDFGLTDRPHRLHLLSKPLLSNVLTFPSQCPHSHTARKRTPARKSWHCARMNLTAGRPARQSPSRTERVPPD